MKRGFCGGGILRGGFDERATRRGSDAQKFSPFADFSTTCSELERDRARSQGRPAPPPNRKQSSGC